jgi:hypothetical protein
VPRALARGATSRDNRSTNVRYSRTIIQSRRSASGHCWTSCCEPRRAASGPKSAIRWPTLPGIKRQTASTRSLSERCENIDLGLHVVCTLNFLYCLSYAFGKNSIIRTGC